MSALLTPRRKCILEHLSENGGEASVEEIISRILAFEKKGRGSLGMIGTAERSS
ncbi:MAG: hypothetical protein PWQ22_1427 [Archaeoglobaceae archaeon]|nr:hypothetical protein [Archaeoglobaceae archaeon]